MACRRSSVAGLGNRGIAHIAVLAVTGVVAVFSIAITMLVPEQDRANVPEVDGMAPPQQDEVVFEPPTPVEPTNSNGASVPPSSVQPADIPEAIDNRAGAALPGASPSEAYVTPPDVSPAAVAPAEAPRTVDTFPVPEQRPVLYAVEPTEGPVGTELTLRGSDLAGFEGDLDAWIVNDAGVVGHLPSQAPAIYPAADTITVTIPARVCTENISYTGPPCPEYLTITPGTYELYTAPWGNESNRLSFVVTEQSACNGLERGACFQTPECVGRYGPSGCEGGVCTTDHVFAGCDTMGSYDRTQYGEALVAADATLGTEYIHPHDAMWPPYIYKEYDAYDCPVDAVPWRELPQETREVTVDGAAYCRSVMSEGAAGSLYKEYVYTTEHNSMLYRTWFTLRFVNCDGHAREEDRAACLTERETFDVDRYVHDQLRTHLGISTSAYRSYGRIANSLSSVDTTLDEVTIQPSDPLPRTLELGDTSVTIQDIVVTIGDAPNEREYMHVRLYTGLVHPSGRANDITYYYTNTLGWQEGIICPEGVLCGSAGGSMLITYLPGRPATLEEMLQTTYYAEPEQIEQWYEMGGWTTQGRQHIVIDSIDVDPETGAWKDLRVVLEESIYTSGPVDDE